MEWLAGKALRNKEAITELNQMYEEWIYRQSEVQALLEFVEANPEVFEITEDDAIQDDCKKVLDDITNKIIKDFN